jgi:hypothetical protein
MTKYTISKIYKYTVTVEVEAEKEAKRIADTTEGERSALTIHPQASNLITIQRQEYK